MASSMTLTAPHRSLRDWLIGSAHLSAVCLLVLTGCATHKGLESSDTREQLGGVREEVGQLQAAIGRLQAEVRHIDGSLVKLAGRLDALDQRLTARESQSRQTAEVPPSEALGKSAPKTESYPASPESRPIETGRLDARAGQASQPAPEASAAAREAPKGLRRGMTEEEVRRMLGSPSSTKVTVFYFYWNYPGGKSVSFDWSGRVRGWEGF